MNRVSLTTEQREKEAAVLGAIVLDSLIVIYFILVGIFSGSMTFISELIRCLLLMAIEYASYIILRRTHRGEYRDFDFGTGKIERIVNLLVAFSLCFACLYIFGKIISVGEDTPMSTTNLLLAVVGSDVNLIVNIYFALAFIRVNRKESSVIISSQIKSRLAKTVASLIVLLVLILTLWLPDPRAARTVDLLGSIFILCYMLVIAVGLIKESLPEILDRSVPEPDHFQILRVLATNFDRYDGFREYRTRRSGKDLFILLTLCFLRETTLSQIENRLAPIRQALESELPGAKVTIIPEIIEAD